MKDPVRILRLEREALEGKIEDLNRELREENYEFLIYKEKEILDFWKNHKKKLQAILDLIHERGFEIDAGIKHITKLDIHREFIKNMKTNLCESEIVLKSIHKFYLETKIQDILLIQIIPEWNEFKGTEGRRKMAKSKEDKIDA